MSEIDIKSEDLFALADIDIKDGFIERAHNQLENILKTNPSFGKAHNHLGWLNETKYQNFEQAEFHYKKALELSPNYFSTYYNYAILLSTMQRFDELNNLLSKALEIPGINKATIFNEYGIMFENLGEYNKAITYYKDAAKITMSSKSLDKFMESIKRCETKSSL